ncbi:MAG: IS256 family transposase, partial [Propionibacteriaceae bacterium]|nr:IS256 family transposase [Propionibacteriaceae bacterium]
MKKNYQPAPTPTPATYGDVVIPAEDITRMLEDGLLAMAASVGLKIMTQLMDDDVANLAGPKGKHDPTRSAVRHGY